MVQLCFHKYASNTFPQSDSRVQTVFLSTAFFFLLLASFPQYKWVKQTDSNGVLLVNLSRYKIFKSFSLYVIKMK